MSQAQARDPAEVRRVLTASFIGATSEWYDFFLYRPVAGIVLNKPFLPADALLVAITLAYGTFAVGFVSRPLGGVIFGHFSGRRGGKSMLVMTLMITDIATVLIGLALGLCMASGVVALLSWLLSDAQFLAWGWRVALLLVVVGMYIRLNVMETPAFAKIKDAGEEIKLGDQGGHHQVPGARVCWRGGGRCGRLLRKAESSNPARSRRSRRAWKTVDANKHVF